MTFATPLLAAIAAAVAIPSLVILYFLKLRRRNAEVSSTLLWKKTIQDLRANAPLQKLRRNILLLLQLLMLAAALLALAQPQSRSEAQTGTRHVIMIDRSASMNALDGDPEGRSRLDAAKRRAIEEIDALKEASPFSLGSGENTGDEAMVIAFDAAAADIMQTFTGDKALLRAAVERVEPTDIQGAIGEAFRLAQAHRARRTVLDDAGQTRDPNPIEIEGQVTGPPQTFHLFTDGRLPDLNQFLPTPDDTVFYHVAGDPNARNIAITGLRAERAYDRPERLSIFVGLHNGSPQARAVDVELLLDGTPSALREVRLPAPEISPARPEAEAQPDFRPSTGGLVFELERAAGAIATVRLRTGGPDGGDVLPTDDEGYLVIPPARQNAVAVVTAGNLFLAEALAGLPLAELARFTPAEYAALPADDRAAFDVTVLDGVLPPDIPDGRPLPEGRFLVFNAVPGGPEGLIDRGPAEFTAFIDWQRGHPALRSLTLDAVRIAQIRRLEPAPAAAADVIAETTVGPGIVELTTTESRALVVPFDLAESTWPFNVSFVVFLAAAIDHLGADAADRTAGAGENHPPPGAVYTTRLPPAASSVFLTPPGGGNQQLRPGEDGRVVVGPLRRAGVYQIEWSGPASPRDVRDGDRARRFFAASLLDPAESFVVPAAEAALADRIVASAGDGRTQITRRYWPYLILAALAVLMLEWYIFNRKIYL